MGDMGSKHKADFRAAGDPLRLATRLVRASALMLPGGAVISEDTRTKGAGKYAVQEVDRITFDGHEAPVVVYELIGTHGEQDESRAAAARHFQRALGHYHRREWSSALSAFEEAGVRDLGYGFTRRYATRCWLHLQVPEFDRVCRLNEDEMNGLLRRLDWSDLLEAMREMDADYKQAFLRRMSQRVRRFMEEEMESAQLTAYSKEELLAKYRRIADAMATQEHVSSDHTGDVD